MMRIDSARRTKQAAVLHFVIACKLTEFLQFVENFVEARWQKGAV
jgi:hypothetical protein